MKLETQDSKLKTAGARRPWYRPSLTTQILIDLRRKLNAPDKPNTDTVAKDWLAANGLG